MSRHYIIPLFIPHYGCQHQCIFCNQNKITGQVSPADTAYVYRTIETYLKWFASPSFVEAAFYGGSFTALPLTIQRQLLEPAYQALQAGKIHAIRLSTRPDALTIANIRMLLQYGVTIVELGVQSLDDQVLKAANRGHSSQDVYQAIEMLAAFPIQIGLQLMPGLPGEDWSSLLRTASQAVRLFPHFTRIYPVVVISLTPLAQLYAEGLYQPLTMEEAIKRAAFMKTYFESNSIPVIRTGLQATEELDNGQTVVAGPYHPAFGEMVEGFIFYQLLLHTLEQIPYATNTTLICHNRDQSKIRGPKNSNLVQLSLLTKRRIQLYATGERLGEISVIQNNQRFQVSRSMIFSIG